MKPPPLIRHEGQTGTVTSAEISVLGEWCTVPALNVNGTAIIVDRKWPRIARVVDEEWLEDELQNPGLCVEALKNKGTPKALQADIFTFAQKLPCTAPKYPFHMEWDSLAAIRLTSFKDWWENLPQESRKNARRSQKRGVEVRVREFDDDLVHEIVELSKDSPIRQGKRFTHYGKSFEQVKKDQSTHLGRCVFICAYAEKELIGLLKVVYRRDVASVLIFLPKASQQDKRPANALMAKLVEVCEAKGISYLTYGMFNYGNKRKSSLLEFKIRNGFEEILVPRFYVPLTVWGELSLRLGLHRGIVGLLPSAVLSLAVRARERWYTMRRLRAGVAQ
jgi:hypothetical protein